MYIHEDVSRFPQRKNPRMPHFDYTSENYCFITICAHNRSCLFGTAEQRNALGQLAQKGIENIPLHFPGVHIDKYVIMPNHIHAIEVHKIFYDLQLWQNSFHDHVIRSQSAYEKIWLYIDSNPLNWK